MFDKEFKTAIAHLPSEEKDKLILRLLKKDLVLANRLYFELIDTETVEQKREKMLALVVKKVKLANERFYSVGYLLMDIKNISGDISEHVSMTKDKFGEPYLNIRLLIEVLTVNSIYINNSKSSKAYTLLIYIVGRAFKILLLIKAMDADYLLEFKDDLNKLGTLMGNYDSLMKLCILNGFDVNWLLEGEIPDDIVAFHKQLRVDGFLR